MPPGLGLVQLHPPVVEQAAIFQRAEVEERLGVAGDALLRQVLRIDHALGPQPDPAIAQAQREPVRCAVIGMVAGGAGNLAVARQNRVVEQKLPQGGRAGVHRREVGIGEGRGKRGLRT